MPNATPILSETAKPKLTFWYEFASTYSYLSAMRIDAVAEKAGADIIWRPFLLGPIFAAQGLRTSPFNVYLEKGRYMWRDMERLAEKQGLPPIMQPSPFPANGLSAARLALLGHQRGWGRDFTRAVYEAEFTRGLDIADDGVLGACLEACGVEPSLAFAEIGTSEVKAQLKAQTADAQAAGIFGAPSFVTADGEVFWGNDRLEDALDWAVRQATE